MSGKATLVAIFVQHSSLMLYVFVRFFLDPKLYIKNQDMQKLSSFVHQLQGKTPLSSNLMPTSSILDKQHPQICGGGG